jgi:hypothetical protein
VSRFAKRLLTLLAMCAMALAVIPMITPAKAETSSSKYIKKHKRIGQAPVIRGPWRPGRAWPNSQISGVTCFRGIDCAKWPPPIDEDPDRKVSGESN